MNIFRPHYMRFVRILSLLSSVCFWQVAPLGAPPRNRTPVEGNNHATVISGPVPLPLVVKLPVGVTAAGIQRALDALPAEGGEVVLPAGKIVVSQPIILQKDYQTLRGAGQDTVLFLADKRQLPRDYHGRAG